MVNSPLLTRLLAAALLIGIILPVTPTLASSPFELDVKELGSGKGTAAPARPKAHKPQATKASGRHGAKRKSSRPAPPPSVAGTPVTLVTISQQAPCEVISTLLKALPLEFQRGRPLEVGTPSQDGRTSTLLADYSLEAKGKRYVINCSGMDPYSYSLYRLLQLQGYRVMNVPAASPRSQLAANLLGLLEVPFREGKFRVQAGASPRAAVELTGILATVEGSIPRQLLISEEQPGKGKQWREGNIRLLGRNQ